MLPRVSVVVTVLNARETLEECVRSLLDQSYPKDSYEVIVVDGGSRDGSTSALAKYPVRVLSALGTTIGAGRNRGIQASTGEIIAITDGDMVADRHWLQELVLPFEDPSIGAVGGPNLTNPKAPTFSQWVGRLPEECPHFDRLKEVHHLLMYTRNAAYRREAIFRAAAFNERARAGEDPELNWRIKQLGYRLVFNPKARVWHYHRTSLRRFIRQHWRNGFGVGQLSRVTPKAFHTGKHVAASTALLVGLATLPLPFLLDELVLSIVPAGILSAFLGACLGNGLRAYRRTHRLRHIPPVVFLTMVWVPVWLLGYLKARLRPRPHLGSTPPFPVSEVARRNGKA